MEFHKGFLTILNKDWIFVFRIGPGPGKSAWFMILVRKWSKLAITIFCFKFSVEKY